MDDHDHLEAMITIVSNAQSGVGIWEFVPI